MSFIDDIIIGMEMEKGYNELVEVVVRRLVEIDLYKAREIQVEDHGSRVFKNSNMTGGDQDRSGEDERCSGLADSKRS